MNMPIEAMREGARRAEAEFSESELAPARADFHQFMSAVLTDENGVPLMQHELHKSWHDHILWCRENGYYAGIMSPMGHGKTVQIIGYALFSIGNNRNIRIKLVSGTDDAAKERVLTIAKIIEENQNYRMIFPDCEPDKSRAWTGHLIYLKRDSTQKDATLEAYGALSSAMGARCDLLLFDDIVNMKNAILEPSTQAKLKDTFNRVWMTRLEPGGFAVYICTAWTENDNSQKLMKNPRWAFLIQRVAEDFCRIESENLKTGVKTAIPLWNTKWHKDALIGKAAEIGSRAFSQGYRNIAYSESERTFPHFGGALNYDLTVADALSRADRIEVSTGVDLSGKKRRGTAIFTVALLDGKTKVPVDIRLGAWKGGDTVRQIVEVYDTYKPDKIVVETNALQTLMEDWLKETDRPLPVVGFTTGSQKHDPQIGLQSLDVEFANGYWIVALADHDHRDRPECQCAWCVWLREMAGHPFYGSEDTAMAMWFCSGAAGRHRSIAEIIADLSARDGGGETPSAPEDDDGGTKHRRGSPFDFADQGGDTGGRMRKMKGW